MRLGPSQAPVVACYASCHAPTVKPTERPPSRQCVTLVLHTVHRMLSGRQQHYTIQSGTVHVEYSPHTAHADAQAQQSQSTHIHTRRLCLSLPHTTLCGGTRVTRLSRSCCRACKQQPQQQRGAASGAAASDDERSEWYSGDAAHRQMHSSIDAP